MQDLLLGLVVPPEIHMDVLLKFVQVHLDGISFLRCVSCTELAVICKLAPECALNPSMFLMKKLKCTGLHKESWGTPFDTDLHLDIEPLTLLTYVQIFLRWSWTWSSPAVKSSCSSIPCFEVHPSKGCGKGCQWRLRQNLLNTWNLLLLCCYQVDGGVHQRMCFLWPLFSVWHPVGTFLCILAMFTSCCTLAFLTPSLHKWSSCYTLPRRSVPASTSFSFLPFSLVSKSSLSHTTLLPSFLNFLHMNIKSSCTPLKTSLRLCQLCSVPLSRRAFSWRVLLAV